MTDLPYIPLTPEEQTRITVAEELAQQGWHDAAQWLRNQIAALRGVKWESASPMPGATGPEWARLFRAHRGSLPPAAPAQQPIIIAPAIRDDQIRS